MTIAEHTCQLAQILPSSVKPKLQPQLLAEAKLAELQHYFVFHPPTHPPPTHVPVDSKLQLGKASRSSHSWLSKQPQLGGSYLLDAIITERIKVRLGFGILGCHDHSVFQFYQSFLFSLFVHITRCIAHIMYEQCSHRGTYLCVIISRKHFIITYIII